MARILFFAKIEDLNGTINTQSTVQSYTYDDQGNPTNITNFIYNETIYDHAVMEYDGRQLTIIKIHNASQVLVDTIAYTYNDQGYRTSKAVDDDSNDSTVVYQLLDDKVIYETDGTYAIIYIYDFDGSLIGFSYKENINLSSPFEDFYYISNLQGDITGITDSYGNLIVEYFYDAWGNVLDIQDTSLNIISEINPYTYRGYRYDEEINMYYLNSRYYSPITGRFINADGLMGAEGNILGHNMFAYTQNNPVMYSDYSGYLSNAWKIGIGIGAIAIAAGLVALSGGTALPIIAAGLKMALISGAVSASMGVGWWISYFYGY